jgi:hypothetical protein
VRVECFLAELEGLQEIFAATGHEASQTGLDVDRALQHPLGLCQHLVGVVIPANGFAQFAGVEQSDTDDHADDQQDGGESQGDPLFQCPVVKHHAAPQS